MRYTSSVQTSRAAAMSYSQPPVLLTSCVRVKRSVMCARCFSVRRFSVMSVIITSAPV